MSCRSPVALNLLLVVSLLVSLIPAPQPAQAQAAFAPAAPENSGGLNSPLPPPAPISVPDEPLQLRLSVEPKVANPGDVVTYTLTLTNTSDVSLTDLVANAVLVPALTYLPDDAGQGEYSLYNYTLRYAPFRLDAGQTLTRTFRARLATNAVGDVPCSAFVGRGNPLELPGDTAVMHVNGMIMRDVSGSGEGLDAGWQLLYNPPVVSTFSGAATYNYALALPPGRAGLSPSVNLGYSSRAVDGVTWWVDSEWVGMGWSIDSIDIARRKVEYCWDDNVEWICVSNDFNLVLNGVSHLLTPDPAAKPYGRYYAENAPGLLVEFHDSSAENFTGDYWTVYTPDGTQYRLGYILNSEQKLFRVYGHDSEHEAYRWRVDQVTDVFGNPMSFGYVEYTTNERDYASYLANIYYNSYGESWASRVEFVGQTVGYEPGTFSPIFRSRRQLNSVRVHHLGQVVREYVLTYQTETHANASIERRLTQLTPYGLGGKAGGQSLPSTAFVYQDFLNKDWEIGAHQDVCPLECPGGGTWCWDTMCQYWGEQFPYPRLVRVENGYGGVTALTYSDALHNGDLPEKYYTVAESQTWDGVQHVYPDLTAPRTSYEHSGSCWDSDGQGCDAPGLPSDKLMGFGQATVRHQEYDGGWGTLFSVVHQFDTSSYWKMGRETLGEVYEGDLETLLTHTDNTYIDSSNGLPSGIHFVYLSESTKYPSRNFLI